MTIYVDDGKKVKIYDSVKTKVAKAVMTLLETDEVYQLMYEGEEIYTKADMVAMLTELQTEIEEIKMGDSILFGFEPVNKFYEGVSASSRVIKQKINALNEDK